jgi:glutamate dehydrogenase
MSQKERKQIIKTICSHIKKHVSVTEYLLLEKFVEQYLYLLSYEDLRECSVNDFAALILSQWKLAQGRKTCEARVRIYNPTMEINGWTSAHTVLEISQDDMPFLVDSVRMEINRHNLGVHFIIHVGGMKLRRDKKGKITEILPWGSTQTDCQTEAPLHFEIDKTTDATILEQLKKGLEKVLQDVRYAVSDWSTMMAQIEDSIQNLRAHPPALPKEEIEESIDFLHWLGDNHFTFLGCRDYDLVTHNNQQALKMVQDSGLGVLRDTTNSLKYRNFSEMPPEALSLMLSPQAIIIAKTNTPSTVHRPVYSDYIGVKRFDDKGNLIGERRFIGLFTSLAYSISPRDIPFLRLKVAKILEASRLLPKSHAWKSLINILDAMPRNDLFQASVTELEPMALGILSIEERDKIRLFARRDIYGRYVSCLLFVPKYRYNNELRQLAQTILEQAMNGKMTEFQTLFGDSILAQIHFIIRVDIDTATQFDLKKVEQTIIQAATLWQDQLRSLLINQYREEEGLRLYAIYSQAFSASYREKNSAQIAAQDIIQIQALSTIAPINFNFTQTATGYGFKIYRLENAAPLSDVMPILENLGMRVINENSYEVKRVSTAAVWISDFDIVSLATHSFDFATVKPNFENVFAHVWQSNAENDGFNKLVTFATLNMEQIILLRAIAKYIRQIGVSYNQSYIEETVCHYPHIAHLLIEFFLLRFTPNVNTRSQNEGEAIVSKISKALDKVDTLEQDTILRLYLTCLKAMLRTNYFQLKDNAPKTYLSFKFNPQLIIELPKPRPAFEIFVYSPAFEGIHLRCGKVARGGLRWSDRREDFRTEVLGLMKAQQVKNSVIVPTGAKGGFVVKINNKLASRDQQLEDGKSCYRNFIRGLLDITDNYVENKVIHPEKVVCYDGDDPYLVVAADKGTASFSDIANEISREYRFWLDDAFASGGKTGYDHKAMGITARGVWVSVQRHFRTLGINPYKHAFTVLGIGDMSGDLFGNGLLLSPQMKLVAAFNHQHIFIDPNPDLKKSFAERGRLFALPRSSWTDYNLKAISTGGGIFSRSEKSIKLSKEIRALLKLKQDTIVPNELIHTLLMMEVDLLWNGGIGTYVKAANQLNTDVGDRANDSLRVNGSQLGCRVIGEGGNLGCTQAGRIEYALKGGLNYTDFIDNSGGVDCSDKEVNIKILLAAVVKEKLLNETQRNKLLKEMTDEVAQLVLLDNYRQTQAIELAKSQATKQVDLYGRFVNLLEEKGVLERELEALPNIDTIMLRKSEGKGFTAPEISIIFSYSKILLQTRLLESNLPEDPWLAQYVYTAFPQRLLKRYPEQIANHQLRREIIATQLSNDLVNEMGPVFIFRVYHETGADYTQVVRAYAISSEVFKLKQLWHEIQDLDGQIPAQLQIRMMLQVTKLVRRASRWFVRRYRENLDIEFLIETYQPSVEKVSALLPHALVGVRKDLFDTFHTELLKDGVPETLATKIAISDSLFAALDIIEEASTKQISLKDIVPLYYALGDKLSLGWLRYEIRRQRNETHWEGLAMAGILDDIDAVQCVLAANVLRGKSKMKTAEERIESWSIKNDRFVQRWLNMINSIRSTAKLAPAMLYVGLRELQDLAITCAQRDV